MITYLLQIHGFTPLCIYRFSLELMYVMYFKFSMRFGCSLHGENYFSCLYYRPIIVIPFIIPEIMKLIFDLNSERIDSTKYFYS